VAFLLDSLVVHSGQSGSCLGIESLLYSITPTILEMNQEEYWFFGSGLGGWLRSSHPLKSREWNKLGSVPQLV
jgi:hypothetical protein